MAAAIARCEIKTILTSRIFLSKAGLDQMDGMVFLEDVLKQMKHVRESPHASLRRGCSVRGRSIVSTRAARARRAGDRDLLERQHRRSKASC